MAAEKIQPNHFEEAPSEENGSNQDRIDLNNNLSAKYGSPSQDMMLILIIYRIKNPLAGLPHDRLMRNVDEFANENGLGHISELMKRGALVAQDPANFEEVDGLRDDEREALRNEVLHKWRQPTSMYFTVILCSIGAAVQGWDQTGSNGANLSFPVEFGIQDK